MLNTLKADDSLTYVPAYRLVFVVYQGCDDLSALQLLPKPSIHLALTLRPDVPVRTVVAHTLFQVVGESLILTALQDNPNKQKAVLDLSVHYPKVRTALLINPVLKCNLMA
jgi:hypothetical protein